MRRQKERPPPWEVGGGLRSELPARTLDQDRNQPIAASQPPSAADAIDLMRFDYLAEVLDYAVSYATSAREAARRGSRQLVRLHTGQTKTAIDSALEVAADLGLDPPGQKPGGWRQ